MFSPTTVAKVNPGSRSILRLVFRIFVRTLIVSVIGILIFALYKSLQWNLKYFNKQKFVIEFKNESTEYWVKIPRNEFTCNGTTQVLVMILSRREDYANRVAIRSTWAREKNSEVSLRFILGDDFPEKNHAGDIKWKFDNYYKLDNVTDILQHYLTTESKTYNDLIFIEGIGDSYANLHLVMNAALQWQQAFCPQAKYLLKTDDDTVVALSRLLYWIKNKFNTELVTRNPATCFGYSIASSRPFREKWHKWYVPEEVYPEKVYPNYLQGCTYLCSTKAIERILTHTKEVNSIGIEDVLFTGIIAEKANVTRSDQRQHFWAGNFGSKMNCENGVPLITSIYWYMQTTNYYQDLHEKLSNVQCL